jgi:hypothetical protein
MEVEMPLQSLEELSPQDRVTYRRWARGVFATYGALLTVLVALAFYQTMVAPTQTQMSGESAGGKSSATVVPPAIRHAVKYN